MFEVIRVSHALSFFPPFSLNGVLCDPTNLIWRNGVLFKAMTGGTAFIDDLLAEVFLSCKVNARSVHSFLYYIIITLSLADRRDTRGNWP